MILQLCKSYRRIEQLDFINFNETIPSFYSGKDLTQAKVDHFMVLSWCTSKSC